MAKTEGTYIQVAYKNVFGYISTNSWPFFMIQRPTIREKCAWVRPNMWRDGRPVATGLDRFFSVFRFFDKHRNWQPKTSEFVQPQLVVRSFAVGFGPISVFFPVQWTGPVNTNRYCQNSCNVVTPTWAGASLVTVAGDVASQRRFVMAGVVCVCLYGCGWLNKGCRRWWWSVAVVTQQRWVDHRGGWEQKHLFVHDVVWVSGKHHSCDSVKEKDVAYVKFLCNIKAEFVSHQFLLCFHV